MNAYLYGLAAILSFASYFMVNMVMCTFCLIPGCGFYSVAISFVVLLTTWVYLVLTEVKY